MDERSGSLQFFDWLWETPKKTGGNKESYPVWGRFVGIPLKQGYYRDMQSVCDMINQRVKSCGVAQLKNKDIFSYDKVSMKFTYNVEGLWGTLLIRGNLISMMGVRMPESLVLGSYISLGLAKIGDTYVYKTPKVQETRPFFDIGFDIPLSEKLKTDTFPFVAQLNLVSSWAIYVDIIQSQPIGSTFTDCLRIVPVKKLEPGTNTVIEFKREYPLKVNRGHVSSIKVEIRYLTGEIVSFPVGRTRLKLRFETRKPSP